MPNFRFTIMVVLTALSLGIVNLWLKQNRLADSVEKLIQVQSFASASTSPVSSPSPFPSLFPSPLPSPSPWPSPSFAPLPTPASYWQPIIIYLGSASSHKTNWTESGLEVKLNTDDYPAEVNAIFEAQLSIIGGEAWARLKNKTSGAIMSITEIYNNSSTLTWRSSPSFKLHSGLNTYVIELRSSSNEMANIAGARIKLSK